MALVNQQLKYGLKEWAIAVDALTKGQTIILLRKGGIREAGFQIQHRQIWLYPTYEHQHSQLLKPEYATEVTSVTPGWHPSEVTIKSYAEITTTLSLTSQAQIRALQPYHIWNEKMISDRLKWQPQRPLVAILLRVYCLENYQTIAYHSSYGGCKSWVEFISPITPHHLTPVLNDAEYTARVREIEALVNQYR